MPDTPELMLCTLVAEPFDDPKWIFEPKFDGLRVLCRVERNRVELISRNGKEQHEQFPDIVEALRQSVRKPAELDGEIVCLDEHGVSSFRRLQQRFHLSDPAVIARRVRAYPAYIYLFDVLRVGRDDVRRMSLAERKKILKRLVNWTTRVRRAEGTVGKGTWLLKQMCARGGEGIVGKRLDSTYLPGRSETWVKIKCSARQEFVIGGFTEPQRTRLGLGALLVGYYDDGTFRYAGKVGTGYTNQVLLDLRKRLDTLEQKANPFHGGEKPRVKTAEVHWVKPKLIAEIAFGEWTQNGLLRQPRFEGLRMDKKPTQVRREKPKSASGVVRRTAKRKSPRAASQPKSDVNFTHVDRVVFPEAGLTKGDVLDFYAKVSDKLLPHLRDRPVTLERFPEGVKEGAQQFWQKNTPEYYPSWIKRVKLPTETGKPVSYTLVNDLRTLLYLVNQNVLTFHVWFSRVQKPDTPDFVLFDIDPHQSTFPNAMKVAKTLHGILDEEGVENFLKTSGKSGLHVMIPWNAKSGNFEKARAFAAGIAQRVADALPKDATTERSIAARGSRVYVDAMQNAKGKHVVPPYVIRATPTATVSMPIKWTELTAGFTPRKFDMKTALKLIARMKSDPLKSLIGR